jgi:hypothetical protein
MLIFRYFDSILPWLPKRKGFLQGIIIFSILYLLYSILPLFLVLRGNKESPSLEQFIGILLWIIAGLPTNLILNLHHFNGWNPTLFNGCVIIFLLAWLNWIIIGAIVGALIERNLSSRRVPPN